MKIKIGEFAGKTTEEMIIGNYAWVVQNINKDTNTMNDAITKMAIRSHIKTLNHKPFTRKCSYENCPKTATRAFSYRNTPYLEYACATCTPSNDMPQLRKYSEITDYGDALTHISLKCGGHKKMARMMLKELCIGKGMPEKANREEIVRFFEKM